MLPLLLVLSCSTDQQLGRIPDAPSVLLDALEGADALRQGQGTVLITGTVSDTHDAPDSLALTWEYADVTFEDVSDAAGNVSLELDVDLLAPGPQVGQIMNALAEAQAVGEIGTADEALAWARGFLKG